MGGEAEYYKNIFLLLATGAARRLGPAEPYKNNLVSLSRRDVGYEARNIFFYYPDPPATPAGGLVAACGWDWWSRELNQN